MSEPTLIQQQRHATVQRTQTEAEAKANLEPAHKLRSVTDEQ